MNILQTPQVLGNVAVAQGNAGTLDDTNDDDDWRLEDADDDDADLSTGEPKDDDPSGPDPFLDASDEIGGVVQLRDDDIQFPGATYWEIPELRADMCIDKLPEPLLTWAGMATRNWPDPDVWWFYNFGSERTFGMNDPSKMVLAFYAHDQYFDQWWWNPSKYVARAMNTGVKYAVTPNFSCEGLPRALSLWQLFRSRWLGRYMQEVGIKVMPDIEWRNGDHEYLEKYVLAGLPVGIPWISIQVQNLLAEKPGQDADDGKKVWAEHFKFMCQALKPQNILVYSNEADFQWVQSLGVRPNLQWQKTRLLVWQEAGLTKKTKRTTL